MKSALSLGQSPLLFAIVILLATLSFSSANAATKVIKLELKKGENYVSVPGNYGDTSVQALFGDYLDKIVTVEYYDAETGSWLSYAPGASGNTLDAIPLGRAFIISVREDIIPNITVNDDPQIFADMFRGWNAFGVTKNITTRQIDSGGKIDQYLMAYDVIYSVDPNGIMKAVGPDEELVPGKFYWLDNDPDGDGVSSRDETTTYANLNSSPLAKDLKRDGNNQVTSVAVQQEALNKEKIAFIQEKCGDTYASGDALDALYESCRSKKESAEKKYEDLKSQYKTAGPDVKLGDFVITQVMYKTDNSGKKLEGLGLLENTGLPSDLGSMFALEGGRTPIIIDLRGGSDIIGAYTRNVQGLRLGTGENALRLDSDNNKAAVEYLSIDREGALEVELSAELDNLPARNYFVMWLPKHRHSSVVLKPNEGGAAEVWKKVGIKQRNYIQLGVQLGDEVVASRVWEKEGAFVRERGEGDRKWLVNFPSGAKGLFEPVLKRGGEEVRMAYSDSPDYWLPASVEVKDKDGKKVLRFSAPIDGVEWLSGLHQGAIPPDGSYKDIAVSEDGEIETTAGNTRLQYKEGSFVFGDKYEIFQGFIKGWSLMPSLKPYYITANIAVGWNPSFAFRLGTEDKGVLKDVGITGSISVGIIRELYRKSADKKEPLPNDSSTFLQKLRSSLSKFDMSSVEVDYLLKLLLDFNRFQINMETGGGLKLETLRKEGDQKTYLVTTDSRGVFPLALDDPDNKYDLKIKASAVDTWIARSGSSERKGFRRKIKLDGFGRYRFPESAPLIGGEDLSIEFLGNIASTGPYTKGKQTYTVSKRATLRLDEETAKQYAGWQFALSEFTVEFEEGRVESESMLDVDMGGGGSGKGMGLSIPSPFAGASLVPEAVMNIAKSGWKPARFTAYATVAPPNGWEFGGPFEALVLVEKKRDTVNNTDYWSTTATMDMNLKIPMGGDEYFMVFKQLIITKTTKGHEWLVLADAEFHLAEKTLAGTVVFRDGGFTMLVKGYKLDDMLSGADLMLNFVKGADNKWNWTVGLGLVFSKAWLADLLGVDPSKITDDLLANGMLNKDGSFVVQVGNVPLPFLTSAFPSWMEMEKVRNVMISRKADKKMEFLVEADFLFPTLIDKSKPREQWTRFTLSVVAGSSGVQVAGRNLEIDIGDGGKVTVVELSVAKGKKDWRGDLQVELQPRKEWVDALASVVKLPEKMRGIGEINSAGWLVGAKWDPPPVINLGGAGMELKLKQLIFKKMSPWSFEVATELNAGGNVVEGNIAYGEQGPSFILPGSMKLYLELPGGFKVAISNLRISLGNMAFAGDVDVSVPEGNIIRSVVGERFAATLSGSAAEMTFKTNANITTSLDMGPLGKSVLSIKSIALSSLGAFAGSGRMTLGGVTTDFLLGTRGGGLYFLADFGDKGINLELAKIFMLRIKNTIGLGAIGSFQYVRIDDLETGLGNQAAGVDLETQRFLYLLPSSVPPVGFAFFDNLEGNVHIAGFAVNTGLNFPAPKVEDIGMVVKVLGSALSGGNVNWTDLGKMSVPSLGVHDVYMKFPKVPGYAWKDGGLRHTDNLFAAMFGSDRLAIVDKISLGPKQFVEMATANSALDVIKLVVPSDRRKGSANIDLRGFKAGINYDLREDETIYEQKTVDKLPGLYNFVRKVRYADEKAGSAVPAQLMQGDEAAAGSATTVLKSKFSGKCMEVAKAGMYNASNVGQWDCSGGDNQSWELVPRAGGGDYYELSVKHSGKCLDVFSYNKNNGANVGQWDCNGGDNQTWKVTHKGDGYYTLAAKHSGKCLDVLGYDKNNGANIGQGDCNGAENQTWKLDVGKTDVLGVWRSGSPGIGHKIGHAGDGAWSATATEGPNYLWYGPYVALKKGDYRAAFEVKSSNNVTKGGIARVDVVYNSGSKKVADMVVTHMTGRRRLLLNSGSKKVADMVVTGNDFRFASQFQKFYLDFTLDQDVSNLQFRVQAAGPADISVRSVELSAAAKSKTDEIAMPSNLGGGKAKVKWQVADMTEELNSIKDLISFLTPEKGSDGRQHLKALWDKLVKKSGSPVFGDNKASFPYSSTMTAQIKMDEYDGKYDLSGLSLKNNALLGKLGTATLYAGSNFQGASYVVKDDMRYSALASSPIKNDALSSVRIEGRGKITIFEYDFSGASSELAESQETLDELAVPNDTASSVQAWYPLDPAKVTKWQVIVRSDSGIVTTVDAGGIQVTFPGDAKLLSLLPESRLARAVEDTKTAIDEMKPYPVLFNNPKNYLASAWNSRMLPLKGKVMEGEENAELSEKPVEFRRDDGVILGLTPLKYTGDRPITGVSFDRNSGTLYVKLGKATLYEHANYQGKALELKSDIADLGATDFGRDAASSLKVEDGGKAALFSETDYGTKWFYDFTNAPTKHSGKCMDVWAVSTGNGANIHQWDCHGGDNQKWKLLPMGGDYYRIQAKHSGKCMDVAAAGKGNGANIHQWDCHDGDNQRWKLKLNKITYEATTFEKDADYLGNTKIGNETAGSVRVFFPTLVSDLDQWKVSQTMPSGSAVVTGYRKKEDGKYESYVVTTLSGTENSIKTLYDSSGNAALTPVTGSGLEYPLRNYRLYVKGEVVDMADVLEANKYVRIITKTYTMPDGSIVKVNQDGGISAKYRGIDISPADAGSAASVFNLIASDNSGLIFNITKAGGFDSAVISGSKPAVVTPIYRDTSGVPVGIRKPVKTVPGGFFIDAHLNAGASNVVQVNINVSGAVKTDGNFYMKGNGNLLIANYEISEAAIELSSENGLYIRGKMDLFKAAKVDIEGYLKPDGEFSFTGKAQVMVSGTGLKGALAFNNGGLNINGGVYIANTAVASGSFVVDAATGRVSWKSNVGIGFAGFNSTLWLQMKTPYGAGYNGRAYVDLDIPIYVWGPKGWKCKRVWGVKICWPRSWGNIKVGNIPLHYNQSVSGGISGSTVKFGLGRAKLNVNIVKPSLSVSW